MTMDVLKEVPENPHLLRGYAPIAVAAVLFALMVLLAPTVASERIVREPDPARTSTTIVTPTTVAITPTTAVSVP